MNSTPLVSVIVPIYNTEKYLDRCIKSIVNQTYKNLEIILVDDGSPDNCPSICDNWAKIDSRIKLVHQKNSGVSAARNAALDLAGGEYIGFVDSDDFIEPDMYSLLVQKSVDTDAGCASCGFVFDYIDGRDSVLIKAEDFVLNGDDILKNYIADKLIRPETANKIYKKFLFDNVRFNPDIHYAEDLLINYELLKNAKTAVGISDCLYHYVQESGNSSTTALITPYRAQSYRVLKQIVDEQSGTPLFEIAVCRYVKGIFALLTRLCKCKDKALFDKYFPIYRSEIKRYKHLINGADYSKKHKLAAFLLVHFPHLFAFVTERIL